MTPPKLEHEDDIGAMWRDVRRAVQHKRDAREVAQAAPASAAMTWAEAHGVRVRCLEYGWQYQRDGRTLCWWPRTGRLLLQGRGVDRGTVRGLGRHDRGDIVGRLAVAFPEVAAARRVAP